MAATSNALGVKLVR